MGLQVRKQSDLRRGEWGLPRHGPGAARHQRRPQVCYLTHQGPQRRPAEQQNTATNLGASLGTALIGSVLLATLTATAIAGIQNNPTVPAAIKEQAATQLVGGVPFLSDKQLAEALDKAGVPPEEAAEITQINADARLDALRVAFGLTALLAAAALFLTRRLPKRPPGADPNTPQLHDENGPP